VKKANTIYLPSALVLDRAQQNPDHPIHSVYSSIRQIVKAQVGIKLLLLMENVLIIYFALLACHHPLPICIIIECRIFCFCTIIIYLKPSPNKQTHTHVHKKVAFPPSHFRLISMKRQADDQVQVIIQHYTQFPFSSTLWLMVITHLILKFKLSQGLLLINAKINIRSLND
jgi:hypothetical protein